ncbi:hypothetical protein, partial [Francisella philomiragia]|uniref:hypothetical protein n=1 Tax=Francisella philomiragia TaxID=28110 RepID=UPI001F1902CF
YADYYRSIGTMIFYIPLILFSLCPILFFSNKYAVMGIVFSLLIYLYFYSNSFYSSTGLTIPFLQQQSVIHILFYIGLLLYLFYFSLFIAVVFINVINQARQNGDIKKMILQIFFIIYIFLVIIVILVITVTSNSLGGWL